MRYALSIVMLFMSSQMVMAFCDPPYAPTPTTGDLAREYREEFKLEFETYFLDAQAYLRCVDEERQTVMDELNFTAHRYDRFLKDSEGWIE